MNWPNEVKLKRGRSPIPQLVTVATPWEGDLVEIEDIEEAIEDFEWTPPPAAGEANGHAPCGSGGGETEYTDEAFQDLPDVVQERIAMAAGINEDRSETAASVIWSLFKRNWSDEAVEEVIAAYPNGIGARYTKKGKSLSKDIKRLRKKWDNRPVKAGSASDRNSGADNAVTREIERLAQLSKADYERERKDAAKALGFRKSVLDDLVGQMREGGQKEEAVDEIARINAEYALVVAGNKAAIMKFEEGPTKFRLLQKDAFKTWFSNQYITIGKLTMSLGEYWLGHPDRRQYAGIEFAPPGATARPGYYNLWQGYSVERRKGDCSKLLAHVRDNMARGDEATFLWIIGWWAQILQQPATKMETALAFRGPQGAGKTKLGEVVGSLILQHYLLVASGRYVTGQFNSHMSSLLVLQADEAFWAGDKKGEGVVKDLISGKDMMLEYKGIDPIKIRNFVRLYATGNLDWVVPAGFRDRRWAIFDIGEDKMQDNAYFAAIDEEMDNGGREALLDYLLDFDLACVNLRVVPKTATLLDQQIEGMNSEQSWWMDLLMNGALPTLAGLKEVNTSPREALHSWYVLHAQRQGISHKSSQTKLGMFLQKQLGDRIGYFRPRLTISHVYFVPKPAGASSEPVHRVGCYRLPSLKECRELFAAKLGQPVDWGEGWEKEIWSYAMWNGSHTIQELGDPENDGLPGLTD